jgi:hypothetical protein
MSNIERRIYQLQIAIGILLLVSPWILGFASVHSALWMNVGSGAAVALLGFWGLFGKSQV